MSYQPASGDSDDETSISTNERTSPSQESTRDNPPLAGVGALPIAGTLTTTVGMGPGDAALGGGGAGAPLLGGAAFYGAVISGEASDTENGDLADRAETALAEDGRLSPQGLSGIQVSAKNGVVRLTGAVSTQAEAEIAARICQHVHGAAGVDNQLSVFV